MVIHIKILGSSKNAHDNHNKDIVTLNVNRLFPWPETVIQVKNTQHNMEKKIFFKLWWDFYIEANGQNQLDQVKTYDFWMKKKCWLTWFNS